jgi:hypothetical protein
MYVILECLEFLKTFEIRNIGKYVKFNDRSFMNISTKAYGTFCTRDNFNFIWKFINWKIWDLIDFQKWWREYFQFINPWPKLNIDKKKFNNQRKKHFQFLKKLYKHIFTWIKTYWVIYSQEHIFILFLKKKEHKKSISNYEFVIIQFV